jgi:hypothetical protein
MNEFIVEFILFFYFLYSRKGNDDGKSNAGEISRTTTPITNQKTKSKKQVSIELNKNDKENRGKLCKEGKKDDKDRKILATKKFTRRSKLKRKRKRHEALYFGPLVECK